MLSDFGETRRARCSNKARAAPTNKLTTDLTLSSAERRRFAARTGATIVVRERRT